MRCEVCRWSDWFRESENLECRRCVVCDHHECRPMLKAEEPVRSSDPITSMEAARRSLPNLRTSQRHVWAVASTFVDGFTLEELVDRYRQHRERAVFGYPPQSDSGIRTRVSELRRGRYVTDTGRRRLTRSGRQAVVWRVCTEEEPC